MWGNSYFGTGEMIAMAPSTRTGIKRYKRHGLGLLILVSTLGFWACKKEEPPVQVEQIRKVRLMTLGESGLPAGKEYPGRAEASRMAELSFRVSGPLVELPVQQGKVVKQGDLLAKIDPRDFETQAKNINSQLDQAKVELTRMKAGARPEDLLRLEANVQARKAEFEQRKITEERYRTMVEKKVVSQQEYDTVKAAFDVADSNLKNAEQELEIGRKGAREEDIQAQQAKIDGLEAQLKESQAALSDTELRAPFAGVVARTYVENFEDVQAKQPILSIQDISRIDIKIYITESDLGSGLRGRTMDEVAAILEAEAAFGSLGGRAFPLKVKEYQTEADPKTQTFELVLEMENPAGYPVIPGMNATVRRKHGATSDPIADSGFMIPVEAVFADPSGKQNVWVVNASDKTVAARPVKTDQMAGSQIRVVDGLKSGETIVVSAASTLSAGMKVEQMPDLRGL